MQQMEMLKTAIKVAAVHASVFKSLGHWRNVCHCQSYLRRSKRQGVVARRQENLRLSIIHLSSPVGSYRRPSCRYRSALVRILRGSDSRNVPFCPVSGVSGSRFFPLRIYRYGRKRDGLRDGRGGGLFAP
ncbi:hypothetical protein BCEP4_60122 [Burkholderia cepacia]|nr:hypothetical protein BCEP4_60122 [Burkholderia cepacia]